MTNKLNFKKEFKNVVYYASKESKKDGNGSKVGIPKKFLGRKVNIIIEGESNE